MGRKATDITGRRFGFLVAVRKHKFAAGEEVPSASHGILWDCKCDCGGTAIKRSGLLRDGTSSHCANHSKRWHEDAASKVRRDAAQYEVGDMAARWHAEYGEKVGAHVQGRLFITGQVTNTERNGKPIGTWVTHTPEGSIRYRGRDGKRTYDSKVRVFMGGWAYVAKCSCGWPVLLRAEEVGVLGGTPRLDCSGEYVAKRMRVHKEPGGSPAWIAQCSKSEREQENTRRYQLAMAKLEADIGDDTVLRKTLKDMVRAQKAAALAAKREGKPARAYKKRGVVELPARIAEGEKDVLTAINELKDQE